MDDDESDGVVTDRFDDPIRIIVERRLAQIREALGLDPGALNSARLPGAAAFGTRDDQVIADQILQVTAALLEFTDPLVRAYAVDLFVTLAANTGPSATD